MHLINMDSVHSLLEKQMKCELCLVCKMDFRIEVLTLKIKEKQNIWHEFESLT